MAGANCSALATSSTGDDATDANTIACNLQATYDSLNAAASNISGLLAAGQATCDEVQAYNLWALATYQVQKGMLATLRAGGEQNVPELPPDPTLFAWQGVDGADAVNIQCSGQDSSLSGVMDRALKGPTTSSTYLDLTQIRVITVDGSSFADAGTQPTYAQLLNIQNQQAGLGLTPVVIFLIIASITVAVSIAIAALMNYLKTNSIQVETTQRTAQQAAAFATYTNARLTCLSQCTAAGGSTSACVTQCKNLVAKPDFKDPLAQGSWGTLQWVGLAVVIGMGAIVAYKVWQRKMAGESIFPSLPDFGVDEHHHFEDQHA